MEETIVVIFGMTFVGVILICLVFTIGNYIFNSSDGQNKRLLNNMNKIKTKEKV